MSESNIAAVSAVSSSSSASVSPQDLQEELLKLKEGKHAHGAKKPDNNDDPNNNFVPSNWGFNAQDAHKLQADLCSSCVNQVKKDDEGMKAANNELKQSTAING